MKMQRKTAFLPVKAETLNCILSAVPPRIRIFSLSGLLSADIQRYFKRGAFTEVV